MFSRSIPLYYLGVSTFAGALIACLLPRLVKQFSDDHPSSLASISSIIPKCKTNVVRLARYQHIKPILFADKECESENLSSLKENIIGLIEHEQETGKLISGSVYIRMLTKPEWTGINMDDRYHPASLNKVPLLITYLQMKDKYKDLFATTLLFDKHDPTLPEPFYKAKQLTPGTSYTIEELLRYMIVYSDNDAYMLLAHHVDAEMYTNLFADLGLERPNKNVKEIFISPREYSLFMRVLYSASYLSGPQSEYANKLLTECDFKEGLLKQLPPAVTVAHKFGEWTNGEIYELHESGVVYIDNNPYLITVMTKGHNFETLATIIGNISNLAFVHLKPANS